jgi:hypothetical protein
MSKEELFRLRDKASIICQEGQDSLVEINYQRRDLQLNGHLQGFINPVVTSKGSSRQKKRKPSWLCVHPEC